MSLCALCGHRTLGEGLCAYHGADHAALEGDNWATGNRVMCDFIHRGIVLMTPPSGAHRLDLAAPERVGELALSA